MVRMLGHFACRSGKPKCNLVLGRAPSPGASVAWAEEPPEMEFGTNLKRPHRMSNARSQTRSGTLRDILESLTSSQILWLATMAGSRKQVSELRAMVLATEMATMPS